MEHIMNALDLFAQIQSTVKAAQGLASSGVVKPLHVEKWDRVSINGVQSAAVTDHGYSFDAARQTAHIFWEFADLKIGSKRQRIEATTDVRGRVTVSLDDDAQGPDDPVIEAAPRIAMRPIVTLSGVKISIELIFELAGRRQDYRFDGRVFP